MVADLIFTSDPIEVHIAHYMKHTFRYGEWIISDNYVPNDVHSCFCEYSIIATKSGIADDEMLYEYRVEEQDVINMITLLIPLCGLPSLNSPKYQDFNKGIALIGYN